MRINRHFLALIELTGRDDFRLCTGRLAASSPKKLAKLTNLQFSDVNRLIIIIKKLPETMERLFFINMHRNKLIHFLTWHYEGAPILANYINKTGLSSC